MNKNELKPSYLEEPGLIGLVPLFLKPSNRDTDLRASFSKSSRKKTIVVVPYDPEWPILFEKETESIQKALGKSGIAIHHFGSTSVPGLSAKPKIDILVVIKNFQDINYKALEMIGFESRGEVVPTGRYFVKASPKIHLHIFEEGNSIIERNLLFRDYLRTHEDVRNEYASFKKKLAAEHTCGISYWKAKREYIDQIIEKAIGEMAKKASHQG